MPAGEFMFAPRTWGTAVVPVYTDCGAEDVIITVWKCGDPTDDGVVDIDDVVRTIECIFSADCFNIPHEVFDVDCSGNWDIDDVVYLINYIFAGGPPPCDPDDDGVPNC